MSRRQRPRIILIATMLSATLLGAGAHPARAHGQDCPSCPSLRK